MSGKHVHCRRPLVVCTNDAFLFVRRNFVFDDLLHVEVHGRPRDNKPNIQGRLRMLCVKRQTSLGKLFACMPYCMVFVIVSSIDILVRRTGRELSVTPSELFVKSPGSLSTRHACVFIMVGLEGTEFVHPRK